MRVYVRPEPSSLSAAMHRTAGALERHIPRGFALTRKPEHAELQVLYVIGHDTVGAHLRSPQYAMMQCCGLADHDKETGNNIITGEPSRWAEQWKNARLVWSYLDFRKAMPEGAKFLYSPLGVDPEFAQYRPNGDHRDIDIMTSGYVSGACAEAIDEVALAAARLDMRVMHLGPHNVQGMPYRPPKWHSVRGIGDHELADLYGHSRYVSGLRHVEGFELPVLEGLACGARPIVFDRPDMREWFDEHAVFVPECSGEELIERLAEVLAQEPDPVTEEERQYVLQKFDWEVIATRFWNMLGVSQ